MILLQPKSMAFSEYYDYARQNGFGFEVIDFMFPAVLDDKETTKKLLKLYKNSPVVSLHGPFIDINYSGGDSLAFNVAKLRIEQCAVCACSLGAKKMVLHSCFHPNMPKDSVLYKIWSEESANLLNELSQKYGIVFCIENVLDRDPKILSDMMNAACSAGVRVCVDVGHARLSPTKPEEWLQALAPYVSHMHINDNGGYYDEHLAVGQGCLEWDEIFKAVKALTTNFDCVIEVETLKKAQDSIEFIKSQNMQRVLC